MSPKLLSFFVFLALAAGACKQRIPVPPLEPVSIPDTLYNPEDQRIADPGNGYYMNPVLGGDYPDPSVLRTGEDYYMTHSSFEYMPGLLIWHSRDLVNWEPVGYALHEYVGSVWAPDLVCHQGTYYIYFPAGGTNWVVTASDPAGPWSDPVDLEVGHIDPGHVVDDGERRYLHLSGGHVVELAGDGLSTVSKPVKVYDGWQYPEDWRVECFCLESPKLTKHNDYYYLTVAEGGTAGPATSHMVVSSRSETPTGPWEHSPWNPVIHTESREETWWSKGHGTLVSTPGNKWYIMFHGYEKGYHTLGRQTLMEPVEWTGNGWFRVPGGINTTDPIPKPRGERVSKMLLLSDDFSKDRLGMQWRFFREYDTTRFSLDGGQLIMEGKGSGPSDCSPLLTIPVNHSYQAEVAFTLQGKAQGGLILFYNGELYAGLGLSADGLVWHRYGKDHRAGDLYRADRIHIRLVNRLHEVTMYYSNDGSVWEMFLTAMETSGYHHNVMGGFMSLRLGIYAAGEGKVLFDHFRYHGLDQQ